MKTIHAVFVFAISFLFLFAACAGSGNTAKVRFDMSGSLIASYTGGAVQAAENGGIPDEVSLIRITAYDNDPSSSAVTSNMISEAYYTKKQAADGIILDVPAGEHRYFAARADTAGAAVPVTYYTGDPATKKYAVGPYDLQADIETTVPLTMSRSNVEKNADIRITLLNSEGTSFDPADYGSAVASSFITEVCIPTVTTDANGKPTFNLNEPVLSPTPSPTTTLTGGAYPATFQLLIVKAFASDGAVSFLGGIIASNLASGDNTVTVRMYTPSKIRPILPSYVSGPVTFKEIVAGTEVALETFTTWTNDGTAVINAYSGVSSFAKDDPVDRVINVYFGSTLMYRANYPASGNVLSWKTSQPSFIGQ